MKIESFGGTIILFHLRNIYRVRQKKYYRKTEKRKNQVADFVLFRRNIIRQKNSSSEDNF
jgi:hypothetical protein